MTWTWRDIITQALIRSGFIGKNQPVQPGDYQIGLDHLSLLLDELDGEGIDLPAFDLQIQFNTVANQARYVFGPDDNAPYSDPSPVSRIRPEKIITGTVTISSGPPATEIAMVELPFAEYQIITVKGTTGQPYNYSLNPTWPQAEVYLFPAPSQVYPIKLTCKVEWRNTQIGGVNPAIAAWVSSTTYALNDKVKHLGVVYISLAGSNTGNTPTSSPTWWALTAEVGDPSENTFNVAQVPSGYANGLIDNLALRIAQTYRLDTPTMENRARNGKFSMASQVAYQVRPNELQMPIGIFPWNIGNSGRNP